MFSMSYANWYQAAALAFACLAIASPSVAGDLSPYSLPSQQQRYAPEARIQDQRTVPAAGIDDAYYQQFAQKANALTPPQRAELQRNFSQRRDAAYSTGKVDEAQHYNRLVQILSTIK